MQGLIQIAGITDRSEAEMLANCGVEWIGFPLGLLDHREDISIEKAMRITTSIRPPSHPVLITYLDEAQAIHTMCERLQVQRIQLHGDIRVEEVSRLREFMPDAFVLKSLILGMDDFHAIEEQIARFSPVVDAFITDTFDPATGRRGATGKIHDWGLSAKIVSLSQRPVILAGGLTPQNVRRAILRVGPAGVDSHTGVEGEDGRKNLRMVQEFVLRAKEGFATRRMGLVCA